MTENELLQAQIDELKKTVERLQSGETRYESMSLRARRIKQKAIERYYGTWIQFRDTDISCTPKGKRWNDRDFLQAGCNKLTDIIFKHGNDRVAGVNIAGMIQTEEELKEYQEIAEYVVECVYSKVKELREKKGFPVEVKNVHT